MKICEGMSYIVSARIVELGHRTPVHLDTSGFYATCVDGPACEVVIMRVGYNKDYSAYKGWVDVDMSLHDAMSAIGDFGDKISELEAKLYIPETLVEGLFYRT